MSTKRRRVTKTRDWRETIFYWRGELTPMIKKIPTESDSLEWKGKWVGRESEEDVPSSSDFLSSNLSTHGEIARGAAAKDPSGLLDGRDFDNTFGAAQQLRLITSYQMDDGVDVFGALHKDDHHEIFIDSLLLQSSQYGGLPLPVSAIGYNEFGHFVSHGFIEATGIREPTTPSTSLLTASDNDLTSTLMLNMTLARRYVRDDDARVSPRSDLKTIHENCIKARNDAVTAASTATTTTTTSSSDTTSSVKRHCDNTTTTTTTTTTVSTTPSWRSGWANDALPLYVEKK